MIWEGCGECKYCWPIGKEGEHIYCTPRERVCDEHFAGYRDKECGLVEAISVGNLRKLLEGLDDSIVVDVWFHKSLLFLGKDDFFGTGTLDELYTWKKYEDYTEQEKKEFSEMFLQRNPVKESKKVEVKTLPKAYAVLDTTVDTENLDDVCINPSSESDKESNENSTAYIEGDPKDFAYSSKADTSFFDVNKVKDMKFNLPEVKLYNVESIAHNPEAPCIDHPYKGPCIDV